MANKPFIYYCYYHDPDFVPIHVSEMVSAMANRGIDVHVFTSHRRHPKLRVAFPPPVRLHNLPIPYLRVVSEPLFMMLLFPVLIFAILRHRPLGIYIRHSGTTVVAAWVARLFHLPWCIEVNDILSDKLITSDPRPLKLKWLNLYRRLSFRNDAMFLPVTPLIGKWLETTYAIDPSRIHVVPNGVNVRRFVPRSREEARKKWGIPPDVNVLLSLGSLFPWAGTEYLVEAAPAILAAHPSTQFHIGSGEEPVLSQIRALVDKMGLTDSFHFPGYIPWDEASWLVACADVCVAPFAFNDRRSGIASLRVLSYLACARPVVGSDLPGLGDMLEREGMGMSSIMSDSASLGRSVIKMLDNKDAHAEMGARGRRFVLNNYDWSVIAEKVINIYKGNLVKSAHESDLSQNT